VGPLQNLEYFVEPIRSLVVDHQGSQIYWCDNWTWLAFVLGLVDYVLGRNNYYIFVVGEELATINGVIGRSLGEA
jgi:hypothetical protein